MPPQPMEVLEMRIPAWIDADFAATLHVWHVILQFSDHPASSSPLYRLSVQTKNANHMYIHRCYLRTELHAYSLIPRFSYSVLSYSCT